MSEACGVSADGLKLSNLNEKLNPFHVNAETLECKNLNDLLQNVTFQEATHEEVSIKLPEISSESLIDTDKLPKSSYEISPESLIDTDDESSIQSESKSEGEAKIKLANAELSKLSTIKRVSKLNKSRRRDEGKSRGKYNSSNNYLLQ